MVDDRPEDTTPSPDPGRAKRAPPTIDLEATEVSGETRNADADAQPERISEAPSAAISPWVIAAVSGAVAASLVICVAWMLGWPAPAAAPVNSAGIDDLAARVASIESRTSKPQASAPGPALASRAALEKSSAALRSELASLRAQSISPARHGWQAPDRAQRLEACWSWTRCWRPARRDRRYQRN